MTPLAFIGLLATGVAFMGILATGLAFIANLLGGDINSFLPWMRVGFGRRSGVAGSSGSRRPSVHAAAIFANFAFDPDLADLFGEPSSIVMG